MRVTIEPDLVHGVVASAAAGDEIAFARIVAMYDDDLVRVAYLVTSDTAIAHEAAQAAWAIAWRKLSSVRDPERVRPWLMSVCVNEARQLLRRERRHAVREIPVSTAEPVDRDSTTGDLRESTLDLRAAMQRLPDQDRAIVAMRYALGLPADEIARATGLTVKAVRSRLGRSLVRLRKDLGDV